MWDYRQVPNIFALDSSAEGTGVLCTSRNHENDPLKIQISPEKHQIEIQAFKYTWKYVPHSISVETKFLSRVSWGR